jgi:hypothetical protein
VSLLEVATVVKSVTRLAVNLYDRSIVIARTAERRLEVHIWQIYLSLRTTCLSRGHRRCISIWRTAETK